MPRLEALHQEPGRFGHEDLNLPGRPSHVPRNVVDNIPKPVSREPGGHRFQESCQQEFGSCGGAAATREDGPEGSEGEIGALVCLKEPPAFVGGAPTCQRHGEACFATLLPQMIVPNVLLEFGQIQQQRSRKPLPLFCCRQRDQVRPGSAIARLAQAASCSFSCVSGKKEHAMERPRGRLCDDLLISWASKPSCVPSTEA